MWNYSSKCEDFDRPQRTNATQKSGEDVTNVLSRRYSGCGVINTKSIVL